MFEHRSQPLLPRRQFLSRSLRFAGFSAGLILSSLLIGMAGYHWLANTGWVDAFYNAAMILTGMGPGLDFDKVPVACHDRVKIFAGFYALYSGVMFLAASGLLITPVLHRFFHKLHLDEVE